MTIYFIEMENENKIKIGYTAKEAKRRMKELQTGQPNRLVLIGTIPGEKDGEAGLHKEFSDLRGNGEWFQKTPELSLVISFLIENQHPWYFCRARQNYDEIWKRAFTVGDGADLSAYDDCQVDPPKDKGDQAIKIAALRITQHRAKHGIDPVWEHKITNAIINNTKNVKLHPYIKAWAA